MTGQKVKDRGEWWLPEFPERKVSGRLSISGEGRISLKLESALRDRWETASMDADGNKSVTLSDQALDTPLSRVLGICSGGAYTLDGCQRTRWAMGAFDGKEREEYQARYALRGLHSTDEPMVFSGIEVDLDLLTAWIARTGISEEWGPLPIDNDSERPRPSACVVSGTEIERESVRIDAQLQVGLFHHIGMKGDGVTERTVTQDFTWSIRSLTGVRPLGDLIEAAADLQDLVCLATSRPASFRKIRLFHPDAVYELSGQTLPQALELWAQWLIQPADKPKPLRGHERYFTYEDIGGIEGVARWRALFSKHRRGIRTVTATMVTDRGFTSDRLVNTVAAMESFARKVFPDETTLKDRLVRCAEFAGEPFTEGIVHVDEWAERLKDERHDAAHHLDLIESGDDTYFLWRSACFAFIMCLLRLMGGCESALERMRYNDEYVWLTTRVRELLSPGS